MGDDTQKPPSQRGAGRNPMSDAAMRYFGRGDRSQRTILDFVLTFAPVSSVVDFGCGSGYWLAAAKAAGIDDIQGYDLEDVPHNELKIPSENFTATDLGQPIDTQRQFDLVVSTEVAEHVPLSEVRNFIDNLCRAGDLVLFSAALPYQNGLGHQNEMWVEYWAKMFQERGFTCFDILRPKFWHDGSIRSYYRQNIMLFARAEMEAIIEEHGFAPTTRPLSLVHPEQYLKMVGTGLPPEIRTIGPDVTLYYDTVTKSPDEIDKDTTRRRYTTMPLGWAAVMKHFGP